MPTPVPYSAKPPALERLGRFTVRRRRWVLTIGGIVTVLMGIVGAGALDALSLSRIDAPGSESDRARTILAEQFATGSPNLAFLVTARQGTVDDPDVRATGMRLTDALAAEPGVSEATSYWTRDRSPALRSRDGQQALVLVRVPGDVDAARERVGELAAQYVHAGTDEARIQAGGQDEVFREIGVQAREDFVRAELIVVPLVLLLLVAHFRRAAPALVTLGIGIFSIVGALGALRAMAAFTPVSTFAANLALVMGLALGVDYCLFIIARYREQLARGDDSTTAIATAVATAGRTVLFSGITVATSLLALLLFPLPFLQSFGYGGAFVVLAALTGALVLLPAALSVLGGRVGPAPLVDPRADGVWFRLAGAVLRRPALTGGALSVVVLFVASPVLGVQLGVPDARILPADLSSREMADQIRDNFAMEESDALYLVLPTGAGPQALAEYAADLSAVAGIGQVDSAAGTFSGGRRIGPAMTGREFSADGGTFLTAIPTNAVLDRQAPQLVDRVRAVEQPAEVVVGGFPAETSDWRTEMTDQVPVVLVTVLGLTAIVLFLMTGSVLLPLKATVLNLVSMATMFGVLVWVFQDGNLSGLLGFTATGTLEASIPILMFCIVYGLSMDYEVFIVSRIREEFLRTGDSRSAVALGLQRGAPIVTTAAVILAASFAVYVTGGVVYLQMIGVGMAFAVLVDALAIRGVLLPAFMRLAGGANWWAPPFLRRIHERFGLTEEPAPAVPAPVVNVEVGAR